MYYLIYSSKANIPWSESQIRALLEKSVANNKKRNITGVLIYLKDRFIQVLEGKKEDVKFIYDKIKKDPRHSKIVLLLKGEIEDRNFKDWNMGFKALDEDELRKISGYKNLDEIIESQAINDKSHPVMIFLKLFYEKNMRDFEVIS